MRLPPHAFKDADQWASTQDFSCVWEPSAYIGRDPCFRWRQVSLPPSWHEGNRTLLGCHLFVADRKPAVTSEEFLLKYLGISNVKATLIRHQEVGKQTVWPEFSLLLISGDTCLGLVGPAPAPLNHSSFLPVQTDCPRQPQFCTELPMARGRLIYMTVTRNTGHGVCHCVCH